MRRLLDSLRWPRSCSPPSPRRVPRPTSSRARSGPMLLGVMDDALLANVPDVAFPAVQQLHPQVIRYDVSWANTAPRKPANATDPSDPAYNWALVDQRRLRRRRARHPRAAHDRGHAALGGRRDGQQGAGQHGVAAGLRLCGRDALQRHVGQPCDRPDTARGDALGGLERAQHDEPPDAAVQLSLLERRSRSRPGSTPRSSRRSTRACTPPARMPA